MKIIGYARVSTREQSQNSHALEQQIARLKAAGAEDVLVDVESGKKDDRKNFLNMMDLVRTKQVDKVILTRVDRFGRKTARTLDWIQEFKNADVKLQFLDQNIDTTSTSGKINLEMYVMMASTESHMLSDRVSHGWEYLRNNSKAVKPPFGYKKEGDKYVLPERKWHDPNTATFENSDEFLCLLETKKSLTKADLARDTIDTFLRVKALGATLREIHTKYGIKRVAYSNKGGNVIKGGFKWSISGLSDWIHNPVLQGHTAYMRRKNRKKQEEEKWIIHPDTHPEQRLISPEQWVEIQRILEHNKISLRVDPTKRRHSIAGLIYCSECRAKFYSVTGKKRKNGEYKYYFQCRNWKVRACENRKLIAVERIQESIIKSMFDTMIEAQDNIAAIEEQMRSRPLEVEAKLIELQEQLKGLEALGNNPAILEAKRKIENQIKILEMKSTTQFVDEREVKKMLKSPAFKKAFDDGTIFEAENAPDLQRIVKAVWVKDGEVESVEFNF